jgi:hypothetical protein
MNILLTHKILKAKAFNENIDESWIDWAIEMIGLVMNLRTYTCWQEKLSLIIN